MKLNEHGQIRDGLIFLGVIIIVVCFFQYFAFLDAKNRSQNKLASDTTTVAPSDWNDEDSPSEDFYDSRTGSAVQSDTTIPRNSYYHPLSPDQKRDLEKKKKAAEEKSY